jgi:hypothetical protein
MRVIGPREALRYHLPAAGSEAAMMMTATSTKPMTPTQICVDLIFPIHGSTIPRDHGYALYAAAAHVIDGLHGAADVGLFPIRGTPGGGGGDTLLLSDRSALRARLPAGRLPVLLPLAGRSLRPRRRPRPRTGVIVAIGPHQARRRRPQAGRRPGDA